MVEVVQYLLRDIRQYELWAELKRRVNKLDPTEYDTAIRYPRRFTFLLLGMVYDAVVLFVKAVSDLIDVNQTKKMIAEELYRSGEILTCFRSLQNRRSENE